MRMIAGVALDGMAVAMIVMSMRVMMIAAMAVGIMLGAIASHLGPLGIVVQNDNGLLFTLALIVFGAAVGVLALRQQQVRAAIKNPISYLLKGS